MTDTESVDRRQNQNQLAGISNPGDLYFECNIFKSVEEFEIRVLECLGLDKNSNNQHNCT